MGTDNSILYHNSGSWIVNGYKKLFPLIYKLVTQQQDEIGQSATTRNIRSAANYPHSLPFCNFLLARHIFCIKNLITRGQTGYPNSNTLFNMHCFKNSQIRFSVFIGKEISPTTYYPLLFFSLSHIYIYIYIYNFFGNIVLISTILKC